MQNQGGSEESTQSGGRLSRPVSRNSRMPQQDDGRSRSPVVIGSQASNGSASANVSASASRNVSSSAGATGGGGLDSEPRFLFNRASPSDSSSDGNNMYCVKRSGFEEQLMMGFAQLFTSAELSDVTLACDGQLIKAHKLILALSSPYFRKIFDVREIGGSHPVVILHGIKLQDMRHVLQFVYLGQVNVKKSEIDNFIAAAECLKIDGILGDGDDETEFSDGYQPQDYNGRWPPSEYQASEEVRTFSSERPPEKNTTGRSSSYSPEDFSSTRNSNRYGFEASHGISNFQHTHDNEDISGKGILFPSGERMYTSGSSHRTRTVTNPDGRHSSVNEEPVAETVISIESENSSSFRNQRSLYGRDCGRALSYPPSPTDAFKSSFRPPVISRQRRATSESMEGEAHSESSLQGSTSFSSSSRTVFASGSRTTHPSSYSSSVWDSQTSYTTTAETVSFTEAEEDYEEMHDPRKSPPSTISNHGFPTKYPIISRSVPPPAIPISLLNPGVVPGFMSTRIHQIPNPTFIPTRLPIPSAQTNHETPKTSSVITTHVSDLSKQGPPSTLEILRAKIASGQHIYSRGYRHDRHQSNHSNQSQSTPPSAALGSASHPDDVPSSSRTVYYGAATPDSQSTARPKTKAIRSSQVPPSCRYTAAEVDNMVDQVQHFPGNMVPCAVCQKFVKRERLRAHIHECHLLVGKRILCPHCGIGLKSKGSYRVHIWRHKKGTLPTRQQIPGQGSDEPPNT